MCEEEYYNRNKQFKLSTSDIDGLCGVLSYDTALNQFAIDNGFHPASGYKKCNSHEHNVKRNKEWITLFGREPDTDIPIGLMSGLKEFKDMLRQYLLSHESDITSGENDFGGLREVFKMVIGRKPKYKELK